MNVMDGSTTRLNIGASAQIAGRTEEDRQLTCTTLLKESRFGTITLSFMDKANTLDWYPFLNQEAFEFPIDLIAFVFIWGTHVTKTDLQALVGAWQVRGLFLPAVIDLRH